MAGLRLLSIAALVLALPLAIAACSREIDVPRIAGQLLDERTGKPIEGAALYLGFPGKFRLAFGGAAAMGGIDERWTMTSSDGRFEFPAHSFRLPWVVGLMEDHPGFKIIHHDYGYDIRFLSDDRATWDRVIWRIEPHEASLRSIQRECESPCGGLGDHAYYHCYELMCGHPFPENRKLPEDRR